MQYLGLALYAEGKTDYQFLCPLLLRLCLSACGLAVQSVDVGDVLPLDHVASPQGASLAERIAQAAKAAAPAWNLLFVHADADGDAGQALRERVVPGLDLVRGLGLARTEGVAVVPVRMMETWVLADSDALRAVLGTTLDDAALGLTLHGAALERLADPKLTLNAAFAATRPTGRRGRAGATALLNALGEQVVLVQLRMLPSFRALEADLDTALRRLQILK